MRDLVGVKYPQAFLGAALCAGQPRLQVIEHELDVARAAVAERRARLGEVLLGRTWAQVVEGGQRQRGVRDRRLEDRRPAPALRELDRLASATHGGRSALHDLEQAKSTLRRHGDVVEARGARLVGGVLELGAGTVELERPQGAAAQ